MALIEPRSADTRDVVRTDGHQLRPMAEDSPAAAGVNIQPGAQTLVSERLRTFGVPEAPVGRSAARS